MRNTINILVGNKTFVGYTPTKLNPLLPKIKKGILTPPGIDTIKSYSNDEINITYARNYSYIIDLKHIINNFSKLDVVV